MSRSPSAAAGVGRGPLMLSAPSFVGREAELAALTAALAAPPGVVLVEGEAGVGKSRLVQEYLGSSAGLAQQALVTSCPPFRQPHTLGPVADALRLRTDRVGGLRLSPLAGALRPLFPEWSADLPPAPEPAEDASAARHRVFRALGELLACLGIALLVAEDLHWADEATLEFLLYLATGRPQQLSLVLTYRPEDVPASSLVLRLASRPAARAANLRLALGPLDLADTARLMSSMLADQQVSAEFAGFVHERTDGVPLAVEESVRLMGERDDVAWTGDRWVRRPVADIDVPPVIRDSVLERAGRFSPAARAVLQAAAVLAEPASEPVLAAVSGLAPGQARHGLSAALESGLLAGDSRRRFSFRHGLASRAVYEAIPAPRRQELHAAAADVLEGEPGPLFAQLARHFREAGDVSSWCRYGEASAELALEAGDEANAVLLLCELIEQAGLSIPRAARLLDKLTFVSLAQPVRCGNDLVRALRGVLTAGHLTTDEEGVVRFQIGQVLRLAGDDHTAAQAELERAIPFLAADPARAARAMTVLGWPHDTRSPARVYRHWLRRAAVLEESLEPTVRLRLLVNRMTALLLLGEEEGWADAARLPADSPVVEEHLVVLQGQINVADQAVMWGRYDEARRWLATGTKLANQHDYQSCRDQLSLVEVYLDWLTGCWEGLSERIRLARYGGDGQRFPMEAVLVDGLLAAARGDAEAAAGQCRLALAREDRLGNPFYTMHPAAALAWLELAAGRPGEALAVTERPIAIVTSKGIWLWAGEVGPARVAALTAAGRVADAADLVTAFGRGLRGRGYPAARAGLLLARAIVAEAGDDPARAAGAYGRAAAAWKKLPRPYDALLAQERQARCLLAAGRTEAGITQLQVVEAELARMGAPGGAVRVSQILRQHGVAVKRPRGGRPGYGDRLSPRELEVARLLVDGRTNREIGEMLFLSPKTVSRHIESAMRKLDVTSRTALAVRVVETGLVEARTNATGAHLLGTRLPAASGAGG